MDDDDPDDPRKGLPTKNETSLHPVPDETFGKRDRSAARPLDPEPAKRHDRDDDEQD